MNFLSLPIDEVELVFFDVETTGLSASDGHAICELGAVKIIGNTEVSTFSTLINPKRSIPLEASNIHHIFDSDVKDAPYFEEVVDKILYFMGGTILGGYNVGFDLGFLNAELARINYPLIEMPSIDVLLMARRLLSLEHYHLSFLAQHFNIISDVFHRALSDAITTKEVFLRMKKDIQRRGIVKTGDFVSLYGFNNDFFKKYQEPKIALIYESIQAKLAIKISYVSFNQKRTYIVFPQKIVERNGKKYLLAFHSNMAREFTFSLNNILQVEMV